MIMTKFDGAYSLRSDYPFWLNALEVPPLHPAQPPAGRILVLAPHPDDELLGCGGTLAETVAAGRASVIRVLYLTDGEYGVDAALRSSASDIRRAESRRGLAILGLDQAVYAGFPDQGLWAAESAVQVIREHLATFLPDVVMVPPPLDPHPDHRAAATLRAHSLGHAEGPQPAIWMYEVQPCMPMNALVRIDERAEIKARALREHTSQGPQRLVAAGLGNAASRALYAPAGWAMAEAFRIGSATNFVEACRGVGAL
jgi:LmbE family N-acetylglucosaminyl deacetylase